MALKNYLYIFRAPGMDPSTSVAEIRSAESVLKIVGLSRLEDAAQIARDAVAEGAQLVELCGAFGAQGATMVAEAVGKQVPVGNVSYSLTDINPLHALLSKNYRPADEYADSLQATDR